MLKVAFFPATERATHGLNEFLERHAPRNTKNQPGIVLNQNGVYVFYEDGTLLSKHEQIAEMQEQIRMKRTEIMVSEPHLRLKQDETARFKQLLAEAEKAREEGYEPTRREERDRDKMLKDLKQKIEANEAWILTSAGNQENAREQIAYLEAVIKDIQSGAWSA